MRINKLVLSWTNIDKKLFLKAGNMIEVLKTDVTDQYHAKKILLMINQKFVDYKVNFDLYDCDHILRVQSASETIQTSELIELLRMFGIWAEVLPDEVPVNI